MQVYHITSQDSAASIIKSGRYYPVSTNPLNNDSGLNCFCFNQSYNLNQCFGGVGAKIVFDWTGPYQITLPSTPPPLSQNMLHDQSPWRCFIRGGVTHMNLRVVRVLFASGALDDGLLFPSWYGLLPAPIRRKMARRHKRNFLLLLRRQYRGQVRYVEIVG